jgi:hypothetical protein
LQSSSIIGQLDKYKTSYDPVDFSAEEGKGGFLKLEVMSLLSHPVFYILAVKSTNYHI